MAEWWTVFASFRGAVKVKAGKFELSIPTAVAAGALLLGVLYSKTASDNAVTIIRAFYGSVRVEFVVRADDEATVRDVLSVDAVKHGWRSFASAIHEVFPSSESLEFEFESESLTQEVRARKNTTLQNSQMTRFV